MSETDFLARSMMIACLQLLTGASLLSSLAIAVPEIVDLGYSQYRGVALSNGNSQWLAMRYAAPPIYDMRFKPPAEPPTTEGVQSAEKHGPHCLGVASPTGSNSTSEDCLFVDVQAPSNATQDSRLPVFFYLQGGGFSTNSSPRINASGLIIASEYNIVVVNINYRVGPYGFLTDGALVSTNNGLRDQRKALEWVQEHISKFGGDPGHVVLGGTSAGAASVAIHLTADNGTDRGLFHAAISESPSFATTLTVQESQYQYDHLATRLGCVGPNNLQCLRGKTAREIQEKNYNIALPGGAIAPVYMWEPVIDGEFVSDYLYRSFREGRFIRVPTILGDTSNGGTKFVPQRTGTQAASNEFMLNQYPGLTLEQLGQINSLYPNPNRSCEPEPAPGSGCFWRQASNVYGEVRYMCPALFVNAQITKYGVPGSYAYLWDVQDPEDESKGFGVTHIIELRAWLGPGYAEPPESYLPGGINEKAPEVIQGYWTSFIRSFDPNKYRREGTAEWKPWADGEQSRLVFGTTGTTEMVAVDESLRKRCAFWAENADSMKV
ncbi:Pyrethroid hydrolase-like protein [Paramyrothecium foliicola]|nr:Pyrethroid hydrolase-like protein [Paramyrothecium foliicola]